MKTKLLVILSTLVMALGLMAQSATQTTMALPGCCGNDSGCCPNGKCCMMSKDGNSKMSCCDKDGSCCQDGNSCCHGQQG
jgi:hypothetical protein